MMRVFENNYPYPWHCYFSRRNVTPIILFCYTGALANLAQAEENRLIIAPTPEAMVSLFAKYVQNTGSPLDQGIQVRSFRHLLGFFVNNNNVG